jgi:nucleoside-triphosphatase THEP1
MSKINQEKRNWKSILKYCFESPENILQSITIICAVVALVLELFHLTSDGFIRPIILSTLAVIATNLLLDRKSREESIKMLKDEQNKIELLIDKVSNDVTADTFFKSETSEKSLIESAEKEIIIVQETGHLLAETLRKDLNEFLKRGGKIRWISVANAPAIVELMAFRNHSLTTSEMSNRMNSGNEMIGVLNRETTDHHLNFEVRYFPFPADITGLIKDPYHNDKSKRKALIRMQGFQVPFNEKIDFNIFDNSSPKVFKIFLNQFEKIWKNSNKCILITGVPRTGKSSLLLEVAMHFKNEVIPNNRSIKMGGIVTLEILDKNGNRVGFESLNINTGEKRQIARKGESGSYELVTDHFENFVLPIIQHCIEHCTLLIIDEIGPIQSVNEHYIELIKKAFERKDLSIIGVVAKLENSPFTIFSKNYRTSLLELDHINREEIKKFICNEFNDTKGKNINTDGLFK